MRQYGDRRNYDDTKLICNYISGVVGLSKRATRGFIDIVYKAIVHRLALKSVSNEDSRMKEFGIEIPYIGRIDMKLENDKIVIDNVLLENEFEDMLKNAIVSGKSPLMDDVQSAVVSIIKSRYNSIL